MAEKTRARAWRPALATIATTLVTVVALIPPAPAQAGPTGESGGAAPASQRYKPRYTYVECDGRPNSGRIARVAAAGRGRVLITGSVTPCRPAKPRDAVAIGWYADNAEDDRGITKLLRYHGRPAYHFHGTAQIPAGTRRVCMASTPTQVHDCVRVIVPTLANGGPGLPVVGDHIPVRDADLPIIYPNCGSCWP